MKIDARKRMLMIALICLLGFQPQAQAHTVRVEAKFVGAIIALYALFNMRYVTDSIGACFKSVGDLLQSLARIRISEEDKGLKAAKKEFDSYFKVTTSKKNMTWKCYVYDMIPHLMEKQPEEIYLVYDQQHQGNLSEFLNEDQARIYAKDRRNIDYLYGMSHLFIPDQTMNAINGDIDSWGMSDTEYYIFQNGINKANFASIADLYQFVAHAKNSIKTYRKEVNKQLITLCCAHLACESGTFKQLKPDLIHRKPSEIINIFHKASVTRNNSKGSSKLTEISADNVLATMKQTEFDQNMHQLSNRK